MDYSLHLNGRPVPAKAIAAGKDGQVLSIKPGFIERAALPLFMLVFLAVVWMGYSIRYPEIINARAEIGAKSATGGFALIIQLPQNNLANIGRTIGVRFKPDNVQAAGFQYLNGVLLYVYNNNGYGSITAKVNFPGNATIPEKTLTGLQGDVCITVKDIRLIQHLFYNRSKSIK